MKKHLISSTIIALSCLSTLSYASTQTNPAVFRTLNTTTPVITITGASSLQLGDFAYKNCDYSKATGACTNIKDKLSVSAASANQITSVILNPFFNLRKVTDNGDGTVNGYELDKLIIYNKTPGDMENCDILAYLDKNISQKTITVTVNANACSYGS